LNASKLVRFACSLGRISTSGQRERERASRYEQIYHRGVFWDRFYNANAQREKAHLLHVLQGVSFPALAAYETGQP
jgi:hypothetical protein